KTHRIWRGRDRNKVISRRPRRGARAAQAAGLAFGAVFGLGSASMAFDPSYTAPAGARIFFERRELERLLRLYGRMVAAGEWRDYAIDGLRESAVFSVFRRASEEPLRSE